MSSIRVLSCASRMTRCAAMPSRTMIVPRTGGSSRSFTAMRCLREKYYAESHEWIELSADKKTGSIGISTHAASALGDIVFVELPETGAELNGGDAMGAVESVKSASDLYTPVAGTITDINKKLEEKPSLINDSPENEGWIAKIELADGAVEEVEKLMNAEDYKKFSE